VYEISELICKAGLEVVIKQLILIASLFRGAERCKTASGKPNWALRRGL